MNKPFPPPRNGRTQVPRAEFLNAANEARLARCWRDKGDVAARNRLVTAHHALAMAAARRAGGKGRELDNDILQHANIGLLKAADRFDPDMGFRFSTYAAWWIRAEIQDYKVQNWSLVRLPNSAACRKLFHNLKRVETRLVAAGEVPPERLVAQIATDLAVTPEQVVLMQQRLAAPDGSLNRNVGDDGGTTQLQDLLEDPDANVEKEVSARLDSRAFWRTMSAHLSRLSMREQEIIIETYVSDTPKTLLDLGERFGVSRERIRQIRESALSKLRASLSDATAS
ncbi:sigma-70 family RNA polymerase sigma factor [Yoonia vestfoldensis]|uniref:sigma-70 family RNA polymerase sigma factor n=1 Tax=Yoonia vestfoldensis TaxID=245188 RepID=UPI0003820777|nr:sigma-70 family RNA polymerase sigma factor [Yoonia vestfoldensis]